MPKIARRLLNDRENANIVFVGKKLGGRIWSAFTFTLVYALTPLSTTALFTAAGAARVGSTFCVESTVTSRAWESRRRRTKLKRAEEDEVMTHKNEPHGMFAALGKAADESLEIASAIREGRLTRRQFDDWYARRRGDGEGLVITLRERTAGMVRPVEAALARGEELLRSVAPSAAVRRHGRRRRTVRRTARHSTTSHRKAK